MRCFAVVLVFALSLTLTVSAACGASAPPHTGGDPDGDLGRLQEDAERAGAVIVVTNPTADSWDIAVGGAPRGSVGPSSETRLLGLPRGRLVVEATNTRLGLSQRATVEAAYERPVTVVLEVLRAQLRVYNPHGFAVEIAVDGVPVGTATPKLETVFEKVPAGRRMLMLRSLEGPGAMRVERMLPHDGVATLTVPDIAAADPARSGIPRPPDGKGLVRMRNASRLAVTVVAGGQEQGAVAPGGILDIVLPPGEHRLEVRIEGIEARTEHSVSLRPNQSAEWIWGEEGGAR